MEDARIMRRSNTAAASRAELPPSPEIKAAISSTKAAPPSLNLSARNEEPQQTTKITTTTEPLQRLHSIARYERFRPTTLACSPPLSSTASSDDSSQLSALGAVAGAKGVALFRVSAPQSPLLILSHHLQGGGGAAAGIGAMAFAPAGNNSSSLNLAAARGSGVLVWDASGHSPSPTTARLGTDSAFSRSSAEPGRNVASIAWRGEPNGCSLVGATANSAYLWDLRDSAAAGPFPEGTAVASSSSFFAKPSIRFGGVAGTSEQRQWTSRYVQLACPSAPNSTECALLDSHGTVRVFDLRMPTPNPLAQVRAHESAGMGLLHMPTGNSGGRWLTWGMDSIVGDPVVRVWQSSLNTEATEKTWSLITECQVSNLVCVRACAEVEDTFVVVSQKQPSDRSGSTSSSSWRVDLWQNDDPQTQSNTTTTEKAAKFTKTASFEGGQDDAGKKISRMLGSEARVGTLVASDMAVSTVARLFDAAAGERRTEEEHYVIEKREEPSVVFLGLTDTGYLTSHLIPEAVPPSFQNVEKSGSTGLFRPSFGGQGRVYADFGQDSPFGDVAWSVQDDTSRTAPMGTPAPSSGGGSNSGSTDGDPMQFDLDVAAAVFSGAEVEGPPSVAPSSQRAESSSAIGKLSAQETMESIDDSRNAVDLMERIETRNIPCPRLCGATFGPAVGGLVSFHNGEVCKMWKWYSGDSSLASKGRHTTLSTESGGNLESGVRDSVRTLKDLLDMVKASKESQWGEQDSDASSGIVDRVGDDLFGDEESEEDDESSDFGDEEIGASSSEHRKSSHVAPRTSRPGATASGDMEEQESSPSSYVLSPHVSTSGQTDMAILNGQSAELALKWKLGRWVGGEMSSSESRAKTQQHEYETQLLSPTTLQEEDRVVHGGEYSIRPNMQQSVDFLKKLFSHQQQGGDIGGLMSPPDKPLLHSNKQVPFRPIIRRNTNATSSSKEAVQRRPGVYVLRNKEGLTPKARERLAETHYLCSHNASVCRDLGEDEKASVWEMLAQMVDGRLTGHATHGRRHQKLKPSLSCGFIKSTLRWLESSGDVQMLSTMVCVLRLQTTDLTPREQEQCALLPPDSCGRYDSYLRMYSRMLHAWGLVQHGAEVMKHRTCPKDSLSMRPFKANVVADSCVICGESNSAASATCIACHNYVPRCIICEHAVRGLFTFCQRCGHGGHVGHMLKYFQHNSLCPSGCGCRCVLASVQPPVQIAATSTGFQ